MSNLKFFGHTFGIILFQTKFQKKMSQRDYKVALSAAVLAAGTGTLLYQTQEKYTDPSCDYATFYLMFLAAVMAVIYWAALYMEEGIVGSTLDTIMLYLSRIQDFFIVNIFAASLWKYYADANYKNIFPAAHIVFASLLFLPIPLWKKLSEKVYINYINILLAVGIGVLCYLKHNMFGVGAAVMMLLNYAVLREPLNIAEYRCCIFSKFGLSLFNLGMSIFAYLAMEAIKQAKK